MFTVKSRKEEREKASLNKSDYPLGEEGKKRGKRELLLSARDPFAVG